MILPELIDGVGSILAQIEADTVRFKLATGLRCPLGCGVCCRSPKICTTILEMLPAAAEILRRDEAELWLAAARSASEDGACAAFSPAVVDSSGGHCRLYRFRPSVCRLFGFAASAGRQGRPELAACKTMRNCMPQKVQRAAEGISAGMRFPILSGYSVRLAAMEPSLGARLMPISQALQQAILRLGLGLQFDPTTGMGGATSRIAA